MGILTRTVEYPDLYNYKPEFNKDGSEKHITCDGAYFHVLSWGGGPNGVWTRCSEKNCEINQPDAASEPSK